MDYNINIHNSSIPKEIIQHIASFLNPSNCGRLAMVSKFFFTTLNIEYYYQKYSGQTTKIRYFKAIDNKKKFHGRFTGTSAKQAADRAYISLRKSNKSKKIKFSLVETTVGSTHKIINYEGQMAKIKEPMTIDIGGKILGYGYMTKIKQINK